ncbi:hypothetical protein STA3757_49380 (plasmid) [Stanieria sp. NIES-3757]|nr:hypothetical protein STA3757_49380 [Stanieria sp. NIES-3757]
MLIAGSCTAFVLTWLLFNWLIVPQVTVIIDRSYCQPQQWQEQVVKAYERLYNQHPSRLKIERVVSFSDWGIESFPQIPSPHKIETLATFGRQNQQLRQQLEAKYDSFQILSCN